MRAPAMLSRKPSALAPALPPVPAVTGEPKAEAHPDAVAERDKRQVPRQLGRQDDCRVLRLGGSRRSACGRAVTSAVQWAPQRGGAHETQRPEWCVWVAWAALGPCMPVSLAPSKPRPITDTSNHIETLTWKTRSM